MADVLDPTGGVRSDAPWLTFFGNWRTHENTLTGRDAYGRGLALDLVGTLAMPPALTVQDRAAQIAAETPAVAVEPPVVPDLTGDLLPDVRAVCALTYEEIARATGVQSRTVAMWSAHGVPHAREAVLQGLRSVGLSLVGGLGAQGVRRWLLAGSPVRLDRVAAGDLAALVAEARSYEDSVAS